MTRVNEKSWADHLLVDIDRKNPLHSLAIRYLSQPEKLEKLFRAFGDPWADRNAALVGSAEQILRNKDDKYNRAFIRADLVISINGRWPFIVEVKTIENQDVLDIISQLNFYHDLTRMQIVLATTYVLKSSDIEFFNKHGHQCIYISKESLSEFKDRLSADDSSLLNPF